MWLALSLSLLGLACSSSAAKKGALDPDERANYIENYGTKTSWEVRRAFIKGQIVPGMTKDLVVFLVGDPDRTAVESFGVSWGESLDSLTGQADTRDSIWEYIDGSSGGVRFGLRFQDDTVSKVEGQP